MMELDMKVAVVMGWTELSVETRGGSDDLGEDYSTYYQVLVGRRPGGIHNKDEVPRWSSDYNALMDFILWAKHERGIVISMTNQAAGPWLVSVGPKLRSIKGRYYSVGVDDLAFAACKYLLYALGELELTNGPEKTQHQEV